MSDASNEKADANKERNLMIQNGEWEECLKLLKAFTQGRYFYQDHLTTASEIVNSAIASFARLKKDGQITPNEEWETLTKLVNRKRSKNNRRVLKEREVFVSSETMELASKDEDVFRQDLQKILELILHENVPEENAPAEQENMKCVSDFHKEMIKELKEILTPEEFFVFRMRLLGFTYDEIAVELVKNGMRSTCTKNQVIYIWETARNKLEEFFNQFIE